MARPRRQDPQDVRRMIVATARSMLRDNETSTLTARALANAISIPASAIYRIFPTMSDVIMAVNRDTFAELDRVFDDLPHDLPAEERMIMLAESYMDFMCQNPNLWRALFSGPRRQDEYPSWYLDAIQALMARLAKMLREINPSMPIEDATKEAGRLYVLAHGAVSLELDGRLMIITPLSGKEIAIDAVKSTIARIR